MNHRVAPAGLVGAALLLWGLSIGEFWLGLAAGAVLEGLRFANPRARAVAWVPRVVRSCAALAFAWLVYQLVAQPLPQSLYTWLRWLPMIAAPLLAAALMGGGLRASALSRAPQPGVAAAADDDDPVLDISHPFAGLALAAAGTGSGAQRWLYFGFVVLVGWAMFARVPVHRRAAAAGLFAAAAALGFGIHSAIWSLQGRVEDLGVALLQDFFAPAPDPFKERTRIGDLGRIKLNDRIVMRVVVPGPARGGRDAPGVQGAQGAQGEVLLREAAYERYLNGAWQSPRQRARAVPREGERWTLAPRTPLAQQSTAQRLTVRRTLAGGEGLLPLPQGTQAIDHLPAQRLERFASGTVRAHGTPRFVSFEVAYDPQGESDAPGAVDLEVPEVLAATLDQVIAAQRLRRDSAAATLASVQGWFAERFSYSLDLGDAQRGAAPRTLAHFLLRERKGHCEYFATATVLLLRRAGIPARYAAGYAAQEFSARENAYLVRHRHAHAWALAYLEGRWVNVDTTPSRWAEEEGAAARSPFAPLLDLASWLVDSGVQLWHATPGPQLAAAGAAVAALFGALVGAALSVPMLRQRLAALMRQPRPVDDLGRAWAGVERRAARAGHGRAAGETVREWAARLHGKATAPWREELVDLAREYTRLRFDPLAGAAQAGPFTARARAWRVLP